MLYNNYDNNFEFTFAQFDQLEFNEENVQNQLTTLFAYYAYLIIGINLDSFSMLGGDDILQRCMNLTNAAQKPKLHGLEALTTIATAFALNQWILRSCYATL